MVICNSRCWFWYQMRTSLSFFAAVAKRVPSGENARCATGFAGRVFHMQRQPPGLSTVSFSAAEFPMWKEAPAAPAEESSLPHS